MRELGGPLREGGVPDYEQMATSRMFAEGLNGVEEMAARTRPSLICSEHEPLTCHRCLLVGRRLAERGNDVAHILRDGRIEANTTTEERLLALIRLLEMEIKARQLLQRPTHARQVLATKRSFKQRANASFKEFGDDPQVVSDCNPAIASEVE